MNKKVFPWWSIGLLVVMATATVWLRLSIVGTSYEIDNTERMIRGLKQEKESVELKVAGLRSPRRLEKLARSKFGLTQPRTDQVIYIK